MISPARKVRCAVYCRKTSEEGLELEFNSFMPSAKPASPMSSSQSHEGWIALPDEYSDRGLQWRYPGAAGAQAAAVRCRGRQIDVVCYKIDRLTRSLIGFAKLVEVFERHYVTLVSVTQSFNTATSIGRLNLNMILSFAQYERELAGERIRDKVAASRRKGMWMGGHVPWATTCATGAGRRGARGRARPAYFRALPAGRLGHKLVQELNAAGHRTRRGRPFDKGVSITAEQPDLCRRGRAQGHGYPGEHAAIIDSATWDKVHAILAQNRHRRASDPRAACLRCSRA